jgi:hypothetical protein
MSLGLRTGRAIATIASITTHIVPGVMTAQTRGRGASFAPLPRSTEGFGQALPVRSVPVLVPVAVVPSPFSGVSDRAHPLSCS